MNFNETIVNKSFGVDFSCSVEGHLMHRSVQTEDWERHVKIIHNNILQYKYICDYLKSKSILIFVCGHFALYR